MFHINTTNEYLHIIHVHIHIHVYTCTCICIHDRLITLSEESLGLSLMYTLLPSLAVTVT